VTRRGAAAGEDEHAVPRRDTELRGGLLVQVRLTGREAVERDLAGAPFDGAEPLHATGVGREQGHAGLVLALCRRLHGDLLDHRRGDAVHQAGVGERRFDVGHDVLVKYSTPVAEPRFVPG
jgi:hypothetical protein